LTGSPPRGGSSVVHRGREDRVHGPNGRSVVLDGAFKAWRIRRCALASTSAQTGKTVPANSSARFTSVPAQPRKSSAASAQGSNQGGFGPFGQHRRLHPKRRLRFSVSSFPPMSAPVLVRLSSDSWPKCRSAGQISLLFALPSPAARPDATCGQPIAGHATPAAGFILCIINGFPWRLQYPKIYQIPRPPANIFTE